MKQEFVKYKQALALKELGFDEPCFGYYTEDKLWRPASYSYEGTEYPWNSIWPYITSPIYQQAFRWFREKYKLEPEIMSDMMGYVASIVDRNLPLKIRLKPSNLFQTYEEAEQACLDKLIEKVKSK